mgnify:CR=1 FL=1
MQRITSFSVDHDYIVPGMYISRIDGDITTYDLRTRKPNCGDYMDNITMHSMEHMRRSCATQTRRRMSYISAPWAAARAFICSCARRTMSARSKKSKKR